MPSTTSSLHLIPKSGAVSKARACVLIVQSRSHSSWRTHGPCKPKICLTAFMTGSRTNYFLFWTWTRRIWTSTTTTWSLSSKSTSSSISTPPMQPSKARSAPTSRPYGDCLKSTPASDQMWTWRPTETSRPRVAFL